MPSISNAVARKVSFLGCVFIAVAGVCLPQSTLAPRGSISGSVKDATGGVIPNAVVTLTPSVGEPIRARTDPAGNYTFRGLLDGTFSISVSYPGLKQKEIPSLNITSGQAMKVNIVLSPETQKQEVTVNDSNTNQVSTDPANNAFALVLKQEDLDALPDDPDDLESDLEALAGPSAGPGGNQIFIDGFTGGRLPPKSSIREIRINSNPFSAEYDKLGFGRIEIFTKAGTDKFHGQGYYVSHD